MKRSANRIEARRDSEEHSGLIRLWCLRLALIPSALIQIRERLGNVEQFASAIGFEVKDVLRTPPAVHVLTRHLKERLASAASGKSALGGPLGRNLKMLAGRFKLSDVDTEVLALAVLCQLDEALQEGIAFFQKLTDQRLFRLLGAILDRSWEDFERALKSGSPLITSHLVSLSDDITSLDCKIEVLPGLVSALLRRNRGPEELLRFALSPAPAPALGLDDFKHIRAHLDVLLPYLDGAAQTRRKGVNVLIFGPPGVGKTELARLLAAQVGLDLYEVPFVDSDGDIETHKRKWRYGFLQAFLARRPRAAILFDEIEDAMPCYISMFGTQKGSGDDKAWMNRMLEENPAPAFWVGNRVSHIDDAFLRRFSYVLELDAPPRSVRKRMLSAKLARLSPSETWLERQAEDRCLSPALVSQVADVLTLAGVTSGGKFEQAYQTAMAGRLSALGQQSKRAAYPFPEKYRPELVNASVDPVLVAERLQRVPRGNLLLQGPPGSGKTAYAYYLAKCLDRPLALKRASDLHSPWFGDTEQKLAEMFREASQEGAVLLLDEADSFLYDRRGAARSWEVAHVNELLTQMEYFEGVFICTTNFSEHLDPAAMRRFAAKVRFEALKSEQSRMLFLDTTSELGIVRPEELDQERLWRDLDTIDGLTPGDFHAAKGALDLETFPRTATGLVDALRAEQAVKPESSKRPIRFTA